jgi:hypothetical protein
MILFRGQRFWWDLDDTDLMDLKARDFGGI